MLFFYELTVQTQGDIFKMFTPPQKIYEWQNLQNLPFKKLNKEISKFACQFTALKNKALQIEERWETEKEN